MQKLQMVKIAKSWRVRGHRALTYTTVLVSALTIELSSASANVLISVNKNTQQMSVSVDGVSRHEFSVSTGRAGYGTPNGTYHPQWMAKSWFSKEYYNSPMPHSIFSTEDMQYTEATK